MVFRPDNKDVLNEIKMKKGGENVTLEDLNRLR